MNIDNKAIELTTTMYIYIIIIYKYIANPLEADFVKNNSTITKESCLVKFLSCVSTSINYAAQQFIQKYFLPLFQ